MWHWWRYGYTYSRSAAWSLCLWLAGKEDDSFVLIMEVFSIGTADFSLSTRFNHPLPDRTYQIQNCVSNVLSYRDSNGRQGSLLQYSQCMLLKLMDVLNLYWLTRNALMGKCVLSFNNILEIRIKSHLFFASRMRLKLTPAHPSK